MAGGSAQIVSLSWSWAMCAAPILASAASVASSLYVVYERASSRALAREVLRAGRTDLALVLASDVSAVVGLVIATGLLKPTSPTAIVTLFTDSPLLAWSLAGLTGGFAPLVLAVLGLGPMKAWSDVLDKHDPNETPRQRLIRLVDNHNASEVDAQRRADEASAELRGAAIQAAYTWCKRSAVDGSIDYASVCAAFDAARVAGDVPEELNPQLRELIDAREWELLVASAQDGELRLLKLVEALHLHGCSAVLLRVRARHEGTTMVALIGA